MSSPEPHLPANQLEATTIHEIEAGFSPLDVAVLGTHDITDAMFLGLVEFEVDELLQHCVDQGITHRYLPEEKVRREWWGAQFWDENGDEVEGSFEDAKAACEPGEMWCYITSREPREGFAPVTAINLRGHEDVALKARVGRAMGGASCPRLTGRMSFRRLARSSAATGSTTARSRSTAP